LTDSGLSGALTNQISLSGLTGLNVSSNLIAGQIPDGFGQLEQLNSLYLAQTNLTGPIPLSLQTCPVIQNLNLGGNDLNGSYLPKTKLAWDGL
jgi:hypothetical protein